MFSLNSLLSLLDSSPRSLSKISPTIAYDEEHKLFYNDDKTLGFGFVCQPIPGGSDDLQAQITSLLSTEMPKGSMMSFMLFRSPDIDKQLAQMFNLRSGHQHELLTPILKDRINFLRYHTRNRITSNMNNIYYDSGLIVDVKLFITVKIPV